MADFEKTIKLLETAMNYNSVGLGRIVVHHDTLSDADFTTLTGIISTIEDVNDPFYDTNTDNLIDVGDVTMLTEIHNGYQDPEWYCLLIVSKSVSNKRVQTVISPIGNTVYRRQNDDGWSEWKVPEMPLKR